MSLIETTDCCIRVPVTETPWAWVCPRKRSTIGAERCRQMQQQDHCTCANAAKAPTEKEMKRARLIHIPCSKNKAKSEFKGQICVATRRRTETLLECPLGYGRSSVINGQIHCKFRGKEKSLNNLSICLYKARKEGVPHKIR